MLPYNARSAASSGGGILRKTNVNPNFNMEQAKPRQVDLLVFGYACKVFRDDAKAWEIDKGKHLIPWMGDANLKIDRYDVRGALSDLTPYEPPPGGYGNRLDYLSAEEQRAEQLCEEERYFFLYNNEEEHILQQEEDLKRLTQEAAGSSYGRVDFQYEGSTGGVQHGPSLGDDQNKRNDSPSCDEEPYTMPKNLQVPIPIQLPETMKQHAIIEKTARFIASQGVQMEILLKAKQSNNAQFEFLAQDGYLNPYYKFVLNTIKNGTYPTEEVLPNENDTTAQNEIDGNVPSVITAKPVITVPTIKYQPSANCAYTQLISKIKGVPLPEVLNEDRNSTATAQMQAGTDSPTTPILLQYGDNTYVQAPEENNSNSNSNSVNSQAVPQVEILKSSSALALAQDYSSGSDTEEELVAPEPEPMLRFPIPVGNLQNIIDKTATYVIKNGRQFEETLRTKSEERFTFLVPENEYYPYYMYKITGDPHAASKEQKTRKAAAVAAALLSKKGLAGPVSFSIKTKEDAASANLPAALPQEPSDDDDENPKSTDGAKVQQQRNVPEHVQKAIKLVEKQLQARNAQFAAASAAASNAAVATLSAPSQPSTARGRFDQVDFSTSSSKVQMKSSKSEQERNAIYEQQQQNRQKELKKAEEKVKDKLAQIAREKLGGLINKDKQLQLERKRKAMAFLNQIKGTKAEGDNGLSNEEETTNKKDEDGYKSDSSETSVHSIPITSYGPEDDDEQDAVVNVTSESRTQTNSGENNRETNTITNSTAKAKSATTTTTTVLLSDDDDIELVSESKATVTRHKREYRTVAHTKTYDERERKRRKYSTESDVSEELTDSTSSSAIDSRYAEHRHRESRHYDERSSSSRKSKKPKKSSKSKKKKKHKSERKRERSIDSHSKRRRHERRSLSPESESYTSSEESPRKLAVYDLFDRDNITPPASPRSSSSRRHKDKRERRHHRNHER